jgi:putative membrane protein
MVLAHAPHPDSDRWSAVALPLIALALYVFAASRPGPRGWAAWRTVSFAVGALLLAFALAPPVTAFAHADFRGHMLQHLLIGMLAPLGLVLGAPLTLVLRRATPSSARAVGRLLRSRPLHLLAHPFTGLVLTVGALFALYLTPLYRTLTANPAAHDLLHLHFLLAGYLFTWAIAGPDPAPRRPSVRLRLVVLGIAVAAHATLAQLMYAGVADVPAPPDQRRGGAEIMYYGGDVAEILLALALLGTRRARTAPRTQVPLTGPRQAV